MLKELVLHVGAHKTGTTLLQRALRANRSKLSEHGFRTLLRPGFDQATANAHARWLRTGDLVELQTAFAALRESTPKTPKLLVSNEELPGRLPDFRSHHLYPGAADVVRAAVEQLRPEQTRVILYTRRQDRFVESAYVQAVKQGSPLKFSRFMNAVATESLRWDSLVERIGEALPAGSEVSVRYFESIYALGPRGFCQQFVDLFAPASRDLQFDTSSVNPGFSNIALNIALAANADIGDEDRRTLRQFLEANFSNRTHPKPRLLGEEARQDLLQTLGPSNSALHTMIADDGGSSPYLPASRGTVAGGDASRGGA